VSIRSIMVAGTLTICAAAWAADFVIDAAGSDSGSKLPTPASCYGPTLELKWDNGTRMYSVVWPTAKNRMVGNDFDTSTFKTTHVRILKFKLFTSDVWPNEGWDGFRLGFFDYRGGLPGSRLWPTSGTLHFFKPTGVHGHVWVECPINWTCPSMAFVAAQQQFYDSPNCDPFSFDTNREFMGHSWMYYYNFWSGVSLTPYRNLMLRVTVEPGYTFPGVNSTSFGRVKALYL
jgi:hypothetical protein